MNYIRSSVYLKKCIIVLIVNKLILIYFTWFVYTFANYKYNVLLKRDDVCLISQGKISIYCCHIHEIGPCTNFQVKRKIHYPFKLIQLNGNVKMTFGILELRNRVRKLRHTK